MLYLDFDHPKKVQLHLGLNRKKILYKLVVTTLHHQLYSVIDKTNAGKDKKQGICGIVVNILT